MRNIVNYIFEKLSEQFFRQYDSFVSSLFNNAVNPTVKLGDLKDGEYGYFIQVSVDDATIMNEWKCKCVRKDLIASTESHYYFFRQNCEPALPSNIKLPYVSDGRYTKGIKGEYEGLMWDSESQFHNYISVVIAEGREIKGESWLVFLVPNKENVDKFKKWIKEANDDGTLDKLADEYIKKTENEKQIRIEREIKLKKEAAKRAAKLKKENEEKIKNMGPLKPIRKSLERLYDEVDNESKHTCSGFDEISKELKKYDIKLSKTYFDAIFGEYADCEFVSCIISNNEYEGDVEKEFHKTWGPKGASSYLDVLPEYLEIHDGDGVAWGIDKNGIFIAIFEYDPCLVLMAQTK